MQDRSRKSEELGRCAPRTLVRQRRGSALAVHLELAPCVNGHPDVSCEVVSMKSGSRNAIERPGMKGLLDYAEDGIGLTR